MLKPPMRPECELFRRHYERGATDPHLKRCDDCRRFAEFVDGLAAVGYRAPLEEELRGRLRGLPATSDHGIESFPRLPDLPMPTGLKERLRQIPRRPAPTAEPASLPIWIRSPRYAVAASYLLTLLIAGTLGNPAALAADAASRFDRVGVVIETVEANSRERVAGIGERVAEGYAVGKEWIRASSASLRGRWHELVERFEEPAINEEVGGLGHDATSA